jgi:hypothetical protein
MPNRGEHLAVSVPVGMAFSIHKASGYSSLQVLIEGFGGALGGALGGLCPDLLDPPTSPNHRGIAHGMLPVSGIGAAAVEHLNAAQRSLRSQAEQYRLARLSAPPAVSAIWYAACEWACYVLSGIVAGFLAGYCSHLLLDFGTPRCLPIVC